MSDMLVPVDPARVEIHTLQDLILLYQSRLNDPSITSLSEIMLMTRSYQLQAFALALEMIGDPSGCSSLVEVGCGCGCFLAHLRENGFQGEYLGIDLVAGFIEKAQSRHSGDAAARFVVGNFLDMRENDLPRHDYYAAISIFGYVPGGDFMRDVISKASRLAGKGSLLTCNSADHQMFSLSARTYSPADVVSMCLDHGRTIDFKHRCVPVGNSHYAMIGALIRR